MTLSTQQMRTCLQTFDFKRLFVEELGWNNYSARIAAMDMDGVRYTFTPIAEQGGMVVVTCTADDGNIPPSGARRKIDKYITDNAFFEHLIIFLDRDSKGTAQTSMWWWVKREDGKTKPRTFTYRRGMMGDALLQKLAGIAFAIEDLDAEGLVSIATVTSRVKKAFDVEKVTKKFYDQFKTEHTAFLKFLTGLPDGQPKDWYASVMLNRLMFLYFIQKKRFLNDDPDYLRTKLEAVRGTGKNFYRDFLVILFFDGLACEEGERDHATNRLLGKIPYLNGGLFLPHALEDQYGEQIAIADEAFERLFNFFDSYTWHLDERPLRQGNEINPDVLGYIFEKYINQKQMGAYYTKEDITGYICRSTILPFLLDKVGVDVRAILTDVEPYIYDAVATEDYLPMETEREYTARRARYAQIQADCAAGKIATVDDLVTYNLDIQALVEDWLRGLNDPVLLRRFYFECLLKLTVLDPTAGSGAFLFAAINILEPLYELALDKMRQIVGSPESDPANPLERGNRIKYRDFVKELADVSAHPNRRYFVLKSIIVNNLYGVDIMDEAVEICKLRLFLKLVAQVEADQPIEALPDIDFNIRVGNTLVGFATRAEIEGRLFATPDLKRRIAAVDGEMTNFRKALVDSKAKASDFKTTKADIQAELAAIRDELDEALFIEEYGSAGGNLPAFRASHKPFHWYVEFNNVLANGGFDVIVGNPPYVEYSKIRKEYTLNRVYENYATNLYSACCYRSSTIKRPTGYVSFIVPVSLPSTDRMKPLRDLIYEGHDVHYVSFSTRPDKLFDGAEQRLTIYIQSPSNNPVLYSGGYLKWSNVERETLFDLLEYTEVSPVTSRHTIWAKVRGSVEASILQKMLQTQRLAEAQMLGKGAQLFYKNTGLRYFNTVTLRAPRCWINGVETASSRQTILDVKPEYVHTVHALLLSTTFFMYHQFMSNGRDLNPSDILTFPVPENLDHEKLKHLSIAAETDYMSKGKIIKMQNKLTGLVELESLTPAKSKPIIDEIDRVLAQHYGFTEAELDFIIHYDIKYRMGRDADSDDEEEGE
jgi:hypothetical protein